MVTSHFMVSWVFTASLSWWSFNWLIAINFVYYRFAAINFVCYSFKVIKAVNIFLLISLPSVPLLFICLSASFFDCHCLRKTTEIEWEAWVNVADKVNGHLLSRLLYLLPCRTWLLFSYSRLYIILLPCLYKISIHASTNKNKRAK